jgi:hypothetical protein
MRVGCNCKRLGCVYTVTVCNPINPVSIQYPVLYSRRTRDSIFSTAPKLTPGGLSSRLVSGYGACTGLKRPRREAGCIKLYLYPAIRLNGVVLN